MTYPADSIVVIEIRRRAAPPTGAGDINCNADGAVFAAPGIQTLQRGV